MAVLPTEKLAALKRPSSLVLIRSCSSSVTPVNCHTGRRMARLIRPGPSAKKRLSDLGEAMGHDAVGRRIEAVQAIVQQPVEAAATLAVEPVGIQVDGPDFRRIDAGQHEQSKGHGREEEQLGLPEDVAVGIGLEINGIGQQAVKVLREAAVEDAEKGGEAHGGQHVGRRLLDPDGRHRGRKR